MLHLFIPYYQLPEQLFYDCLLKQTYKDVTYWYHDRAMLGHYWTESVNCFYDQMKQQVAEELIYDDDVIGIMNGDIVFDRDFLLNASVVMPGNVMVPPSNAVSIDWRYKRFTLIGDFTYRPVHTWHSAVSGFYGRAFFMTVKTFLSTSGFDPKLPHYLSDLDYSLKIIKQGIKPVLMKSDIMHEDHEYGKETFSRFSPLSNRNPFAWTRFLLKHCPKRFLPINLIKVLFQIFKKG